MFEPDRSAVHEISNYFILKNKSVFYKGLLFKVLVSLFALLAGLPALSFGLQDDQIYELATPAVFENIPINPSHFAMGDLSGNGYDDFVFVEQGEKPVAVFFHPDSSETGFYLPTNGEIDFSTNTYGSIDIIDVTGDGANEIMFLARTFDSPESMHSWNGEQFEELSIPNDVARVSFRGNVHSAYADFSGDGTLDKHQGVQQALNTRNFLTYNIFDQNGEGSEQTSGDIHPNIFSFSTSSTYVFDFNNNGSPELYVTSHGGDNDEFYEIRDGHFHFLGGHPLTETSHTLGSAVGDFTNNGYPDIYRANYGGRRNTLFRNTGDLEFERFTAINTLESLDSRNAMWGDIDNNGWLDLAVAENGTAVSLYKNLEGQDFSKLDQEPPMNIRGNWRHVIFIDYNRNGKLDLLTTGTHDNSIRLYRNTAPDQNWIGFDLEQTNTYYKEPIGAKITLEAEIDGQTLAQTRIFNPFAGRYMQAPGTLHFGLGDAGSASITVQWPSGLETKHQFDGTEINSYHTLTEPEAGNLVSEDDPPVIAAALDSTAADTLMVRNIGRSTVTISGGETEADYLEVVSFQNTIAPGETGWIELEFSPESSERLGIHTEPVHLLSDATRNPATFQVELQGLTHPVKFDQYTAPSAILEYESGSSGSVWADFTGNDLLDVVLLKPNTNNRLYHQTEEGVFEFIEEDIISREGRFSSAGTAGDYNRNGYTDLFLANEDGENYLYRNTGTGRFERVNAEGIRGQSRQTTGAKFTDLIGNGYLDIVVINGENQHNEIYLYRDEQTYKRIDAGAFTGTRNSATSLALVDLNKDGRTEIITTEAGDGEAYIRVYRQIEPLLFIEAYISGLTDILYDGAGVLPADLNGSGYHDLIFLPEESSRDIRIYRNNGNMDFERTYTSDFGDIETLPGDLAILDHNRSGFPDIFIGDARSGSPNLFFESIDGDQFLQITSGEMVTTTGTRSRSVAAPDINNNQQPDLFISNILDPNELYINTSTSDERSWIGIVPKGFLNDYASLIPGTSVTLTPGDEPSSLPTQTQSIASSSIHSTVLSPLVFASEQNASYKVDVHYPDGSHHQTTVSGNKQFHIIEGELTSGDPAEDFAGLPRQIKLHANYPNPFNPNTNISFELPANEHVMLNVYDITGRRVSTLIDETKEAGRHTVKFDASHLPSGVYLAILRVSGEQHVEKMMLIK